MPVEGWIAVAELARVFDFGGQMGQFLEQIFPHQTRVPARAAGGDDDAVHRPQFGERHVQPTELGRARIAVDASAQRVLDGARLLENLLEHVVRELAPLHRRRLELDAAHLHVGVHLAEVAHAEILRRERHQIIVLEIDDLAGVRGDGRGVAGEEVFALANADDERRAAPRADDDAGKIHADHAEAVGSDDFGQGTRDGLGEGMGRTIGRRRRINLLQLLVVFTDEMRQHLRVRVGIKLMPRRAEPSLNQVVVFNDPVMDHGNLSARVEVRMRILVRRWSVRGPAGVTDADRAVERTRLHERRESLINAAHLAPHLQPPVVQRRHTRAVVAAILQPA